MNNSLLAGLSAIAALAHAHFASAQIYQAGEIVENVSLIDRATGEPVDLYDFEGKVIFLEWFAHWCTYCQQAASQVGPDIVEYYKSLGGTANDVDFVHIGINLQRNAENSTQSFIDFYGFGQVLNDFERSFANRFASGGQPIFAIINGVNNSPTHQQWELIYSRLGYGDFVHPIDTFRSNIDSVQSLTELANISTRGRVGSGDDVLIGGFVVEGTENQTVLIQGVGPELIDLLPNDGLTAASTLSDPKLIVINSEGTVVASNDNWESEDAAAKADAMTVSGSFVLGAGSKSAAVLKNLAPGSYTVLIDGVNSLEGIALVEAYEVNPSTQANSAQLINISTRGRVGTSDNVMIGGFVVEGAKPKTVLIQGVGNELAELSTVDTITAENALSNPSLILIAQNGTVVAENDNWESEDAVAKSNAMAAAGSFVLDAGSNSAAILQELLPGSYTVVLSGVGNEEGIALVEAYEL